MFFSLEQGESYLKIDAEYRDNDTGLIYLRARWMNPTEGRFMSMDSYMGEMDDPKTLHKYTAFENDGIDNIDPDGHDITDGGAFSSMASDVFSDVRVTVPDGVSNKYIPLVQALKQAAASYAVPVTVLASLAYSETAWNSGTLGSNKNGTVDVGILQANFSGQGDLGWFDNLNTLANSDQVSIDIGTRIYAGKRVSAQNAINQGYWKIGSRRINLVGSEITDLDFDSVWAFKGVSDQGRINATTWKNQDFTGWPKVLTGLKLSAWKQVMGSP